MTYLELVPGIKSSRLGFGCAPIGGSVDPAQGAKALRQALDLGVNHFDVAPSYGYGDAELFLGRELKGRRDAVVIATKFGIEVSPIARLVKPLKGIVRSVLKGRARNSSGALKAIPGGRQATSSMHRHAKMDRKTLISTFEKSLTRLKTDRIDFLLLHEPPYPILGFEDLLGAAVQLKQQGKLRGFGISSFSSQIDDLGAYRDKIDLMQLELPDLQQRTEKLYSERKNAPNVFFSPMRAVRTDSADDITAYLGQAFAEFPSSIILSSTADIQHLNQNAKAADFTR